MPHAEAKAKYEALFKDFYVIFAGAEWEKKTQEDLAAEMDKAAEQLQMSGKQLAAVRKKAEDYRKAPMLMVQYRWKSDTKIGGAVTGAAMYDILLIVLSYGEQTDSPNGLVQVHYSKTIY